MICGTTRPAASAVLLLWILVGAMSTIGDIGAPIHCITYNVGADTHTECSAGPAAPPGALIQCSNHTVGTDLQTECARVPATRVGPFRGRIVAPPLVVAPHCITYFIGSSRYVECR